MALATVQRGGHVRNVDAFKLTCNVRTVQSVYHNLWADMLQRTQFQKFPCGNVTLGNFMVIVCIMQIAFMKAQGEFSKAHCKRRDEFVMYVEAAAKAHHQLGGRAAVTGTK